MFTRFINWIESLYMNIAAIAGRRRRRGIGFVIPTSITISPHTPVVVVGRTTQLYAQNQLGQNAPSLCAWTSSDATKATIDAATGVVTGVATGPVTFSVSYNSGQFTNSTAAITVAAQTLTTAVMTTAPSSVVTTNTVTFAATGYDQLGFAMTSQPTFSYASSVTAKATINSSTGVATGVATGTTSITATSGAVTTPSVTLTDVAQVATTLVPSPSSLTVSIGSDSSAITAGVFDQLGSPISGATLSFVSNNTGLATVNSSGVVHGVAAGSPVITVSSTVGGGTANGTVNVTVSTYTLTVTPNPVTGAPGDTVQLTVLENGINVTSDSGTGYATSDVTIATVDAPTISGLSYSTINQNDSSVLLTITGTDARTTGQTLAGLTTGLTQSGFTQASPTTWTVSLSASNTATLGTANLYIADTNHGNSGTQALTVANATPTFASISPTTITQGTAASYTLTGTKIRSGQTIGGLPTGVTASSLVYTSTTIVCTLTATGSATTGGASLDIVDSLYGTSGTQTLTVNSSGPDALPVTSGLVLNLDMFTGTSTTTEGAALSTWTDQSPTALAMNAGTTSPIYRAAAINGHPGLDISNGGYLVADSAYAGLGTDPCTFFVVCLTTGSTSVDKNIYDNGALGLYQSRNSSADAIQAKPSGAYAARNSLAHVFALTQDSSVGTKQVPWYDGVVSPGAGSSPYTPNTTLPIAVGSSSTSVGTGTGGPIRIGQILQYNRKLSDTEIGSVSSYLKTKWGTP